MASSRTHRPSPVGRAHVALLAILAYLPLLLSAPGRLAADTKLYLYLDPGRLISDSVWSWDSRQLGGWVPHQNVGYLWPTGPFYAFFDWLGCPDWVAQRLWLGTLLLLAGLGIRRLARTLGQSMLVAGLAAVVYQLSPYVLPYISRTSALLLPWSLLPWLLRSVTVYARTGDRRQLGIFGLLVLSTGGLNATALLMIAPAPIIFYLHESRRRRASSRLRELVALATVSLATSAWWLAGLLVQGRYGAAVLSYSEALPSTAATSTSTEVLRGLGYWLFYDRNKVVELTSAAEPYQGNGVVMLAGFAIVALGLVGLARWPSSTRRPLIATLAIGVVLAIGAHPFDDPSPLWKLAVDHPTSALSLALRSSTRAVPLVILVLALGSARVIDLAVTRFRRIESGTRSAAVATAITLVLALINLPAILGGRLIDPDVSRPQNIPTAWREAADYLDQRFDEGRTGSVLLVPGMESAAYRWGYTVDPILPGLTKKPLISRDWLPLGSAPFNDLLFALDDAFQEGRADASMLAPVARLLGADTVMIVNSTQYERFGTIRPERTASIIGANPPDLTRVASFGPVQTNLDPRPDAVDDREAFPPEALPEIVLYEVTDPAPIPRVDGSPVVVLGDGSGTVDLALAGAIDGRSVILPFAGIPETDRDSIVAASASVLVTDSNRRRAHQWRGSQEVWGATEPASGVVTRSDVFDQRLPVFPRGTIDDQTIVRPESIEARASSYGTELRYWPEYRPSMALDGDPSTAWLTTGRGSPIGESLEVSSNGQPIDHLQIRLPDDPRLDRVTRLRVRADHRSWIDVTITSDATDASGQRIGLDSPARFVEISIAGVESIDTNAIPGLTGLAEVLPVELRRPEIVLVPRTPSLGARKTAFVFTRLRADSLDQWRQDPEQELNRQFEVVGSDSFTIAVSVVKSPGESSTDAPCRDDIVLVDDRAVALRSTNDRSTGTTHCQGSIELESGDHVLRTHGRDHGVRVDQVRVGDVAIDSPALPVAAFSSRRSHRVADISDCPSNCWIEMPDGWNAGWRADIDGDSQAEPLPSLGGRNSWPVPDKTTTFAVQWYPQIFVWIGLAITAVAIIACVLLVIRRHEPEQVEVPVTEVRRRRAVHLVVPAITIGLVVSPPWALVSLLLIPVVDGIMRSYTARSARSSPPKFLRDCTHHEIAGGALVALSIIFVFAQQIRTGAGPGFGWPSVFERAHRPLLVGLLLLLAGSWGAPDRDSVGSS